MDLTFKEYLTEAKVTNKNLEKTVRIFQKYLQKRMNTKLYRFGGDGYFTVDVKNGVGALFIYDKVKAMRINYINKKIHSISLWNRYKLGAKASKTVILNGINLLKVLEEITNIMINDIKQNVIVFEEDFSESDLENLTEAKLKRVKPEEFYDMLKSSVQDIKRVSGLEARQVASNHGVSVPGAFNKLKVVASEKINGKKVDYHDASLLKNPAKIPGAKTIVVASGDANLTQPEKDTDKRFVEIEKKANLMGEDDDKKSTQEELAKRVGTLFYKMTKLTELLIRGFKPGLIIYGGPGIGKTFIVTKTLKEENARYVTVKGKVTTQKIYETLFMNKDVGDIILFDDTDSVWGDQDAANVLKAALDSYQVRLVSWNSARTMNVSKMSPEQKEEYIDSIEQDYLTQGTSTKKLPSEFEFKGKIIFISNLPRSKFDDAVLTRVMEIDMTMTTEEIFVRMESILEFVGPKDMKLKDKQEILTRLKDDHIKTYGANGDVKPSIRKLENALMLKASGLDDWELFMDNV